MAKELSVAPRERVNIKYKPATEGAEEVELPLKMLMIGDYTLREDETPLEERDVINVNKDNFNEVMKSHKLELKFNVADRLSGQDDAELPVTMNFDTLKDFTPQAVAGQVPELSKLLELRKALQALKGPLGNDKKWTKRVQSLLESEADVEKLIKELGGGPEPAGE
jgi:type VI secretion system protein ImpB